ncbi:DUF2007 domain-containing protein [Paracoccus sp. p4-l81]|uniref:putative signal transducing protein n=1 Tax=unclassified Paracoccus (in: a-proteobacteria) TaxID=2688777 RepID=UPI0035BA4ABA
MKELFRSTDPVRLALSTAVLDGEGIAAFELDVHTSVLEGSLGILPRRIMVADDDYDRAIRALRDTGQWPDDA